MNVVKSTATLRVSLERALFELQLHNNRLRDDEWFKDLYKLYALLVPKINVLTLTRTLLLVILGRSADVIEHCYAFPSCCESPARLHEDFIMRFRGLCGDGGSSDTSMYGPPGLAANSGLAALVLGTFEESLQAFTVMVSAASEYDVITALEGIPTLGGTGFKAKNIVHIITELEHVRVAQFEASLPAQRARTKRSHISVLFKFAFGEPCIRVGPNPRSFLNLLQGRPLGRYRYMKGNPVGIDYKSELEVFYVEVNVLIYSGMPTPPPMVELATTMACSRIGHAREEDI